MQDWDSINDGMCAEQKIVFEDVDDHGRKGGLKAMGDSMDRSVLRSNWSILSILFYHWSMYS